MVGTRGYGSYEVAPFLASFRWALALLDRRQWAAIETGFGWGSSEEDVARMTSELVDQGVNTTVRTAPTAKGWDEPADRWGERKEAEASDRALKTASLRYRNPDRRTVEATLRAHGIHLPEFS